MDSGVGSVGGQGGGAVVVGSARGRRAGISASATKVGEEGEKEEEEEEEEEEE